MSRKTSKKAGPLKRSGEFSNDPTFDPKELFEVVEHDENAGHVREAMQRFLDVGGRTLFAKAVAVFVRSARARGDSVERILGMLESIADRSEGPARGGYAERDTPLRKVVLRGVLLAFYGGDVVDREMAARERRVQRRRGPRTGNSAS